MADAQPAQFKDGAGERTIAARMQPSGRKLYCSWFCPYAQRAWIALEAKGLDYQYVEINPYEDAQSEKEFTKKALSIDAKRERYPDFIAVSPWGLVPGLQEPPTVDSTRVCDSMAVLRYLEDAYPTTRPLLPSTPSQRAHVNMWITHCNDRIIPHFYRMLMKETDEEREAEKEKLLQGLRQYNDAIADEGPGFFLPMGLSLADLALAPWYQRFLSVGHRYRQLEIPDTTAYAKVRRWFHTVAVHPAVAATVVSEDRLIANYSGYADNSATSTVSKQFR